MDTPTTTTIRVTGMTCEHCVRSVTEELSALEGVASVSVDLASGATVIASAAPLDPEDVASAVVEAGYALA